MTNVEEDELASALIKTFGLIYCLTIEMIPKIILEARYSKDHPGRLFITFGETATENMVVMPFTVSAPFAPTILQMVAIQIYTAAEQLLKHQLEKDPHLLDPYICKDCSEKMSDLPLEEKT